jgi:hypothetical protein
VFGLVEGEEVPTVSGKKVHASHRGQRHGLRGGRLGVLACRRNRSPGSGGRGLCRRFRCVEGRESLKLSEISLFLEDVRSTWKGQEGKAKCTGGYGLRLSVVGVWDVWVRQRVDAFDCLVALFPCSCAALSVCELGEKFRIA